MSKIAILTSGGDAPGMNAAIRAIVMTCYQLNYQCVGFMHGYNGLIDGELRILSTDNVEHIIQRGGTILKSARCPALITEIGLTQAVNTLYKEHIDALIVIGGDGSFKGLLDINKYWTGQVIGIPATIDNDIDRTDQTIGFASAVNTAIKAIDNIRDTANAFDRVFAIELMGRKSGHIAFNAGVACAAERIISFENFHINNMQAYLDNIAEHIFKKQRNKHTSYIIVIAENLWPGGISQLANQLKENYSIDCATCVLGHVQRGGAPVAQDRILATKLGITAVQAISNGKTKLMVGEIDNNIVEMPLSEAIKHHKKVDKTLVAAQENMLELTTRIYPHK